MRPPALRVELTGCVVDLARRVVVQGGEERVLTRQEAALLAYLAERPGTDVPRSELLQQVWGYPASSASRAVDFAVRRLRSKLGEPSPPRHLLTAHGVGYRFVPAADPARSTPGPAPTRQVRLRVATGVVDLTARSFTPAGGDTVALSAQEGALLDVLAEQPGDVVSRAALIGSIWGRGQHARSFDEAVRRLRGKIERDPAQPRVLVTVRGEGLRLVQEVDAPAARRTNLSPHSTTFVPRAESTQLGECMAEHALVTVRGAAGLGKTRLVREVGLGLLEAGEAPEVWFCDLTGALAERGIVRAVAQALGLADVGTGDPAEHLGEVLARRPPGTVVVLDNFEQVVAFGSTVSQWRSLAPGVRFVVTSREALGLVGEHVLDLQPLPIEAAVKLLVDRARPDSPDPSAPALAEIVRRLDGMPLAVELAATRLAQLGPDELLARLSERLDLLVRPLPGAVSHHSTLRGALDWSWDLLPPDERRALARLSTFAGTLGSEAAAAVLDAPVPEILERLRGRSLLVSRGADWGLTESVRAWAAEKLRLLGLHDDALARHRAHHLGVAEDAVTGLVGDTAVALARLRALREELLALLATPLELPARVRLTRVLAHLLLEDGPLSLLAEVMEALDLEDLPDAATWELWGHRAELERRQGRLADALASAHHGVEVAARVGRHERACARRRLGLMLRQARRHDEAVETFESCVADFRELGDRALEGRSLMSLGLLASGRGDYREAGDRFDRARTCLEASGDRRGLLLLLNNAAGRHQMLGEATLAEAAANEVVALAHGLGNATGEVLALQSLARLRRNQVALDDAERVLAAVTERCAEVGLLTHELVTWSLRGALAIERGAWDAAERMLEVAASMRVGKLQDEVAARGNLAILRHLQGDPAAAVALLSEQLDLLRRVGEPRLVALVLGYLGAALADSGELDAGAAALDEARTLAEDVHGLDWVPTTLALCAAVAELARDQHTGRSDGRARAEAAAVAASEPGPDGLSPAERVQDVNLALLVLEARLAAPAG